MNDARKLLRTLNESKPKRSERDDLDDASTRVLNRQDDKDESLDDAIEAVYPDYGGLDFAKKLKAFILGSYRPKD